MTPTNGAKPDIQLTKHGNHETYTVVLPKIPPEFCRSAVISGDNLEYLNDFFGPIIGGKFRVKVNVYGFDIDETLTYTGPGDFCASNISGKFQVKLDDWALIGIFNEGDA